MNRARPSSRRGAALLIALATLVVMTVTCATIARVAATAKLARSMERWKETADELRLQCERPIARWLGAHAESVVLPPDATEPRVAVLHEAWRVDGVDHEVSIAAFDQCGMVPLALARGSSPLRSALPASVMRALEDHPFPRDRVAGLDLFLDAGSLRGPFPEPAIGAATTFGSDAFELASPGRRFDDMSTALGAYVATHHSTPPRINVATAPMRVVEQAMRTAGRGGLELIRDARSRGELPTLAAASVRSKDDTDTPEIAFGSDAWAFRIDVRVGAARGSWWEVYRNTNSSWKCVQRLVVSI